MFEVADDVIHTKKATSKFKFTRYRAHVRSFRLPLGNTNIPHSRWKGLALQVSELLQTGYEELNQHTRRHLGYCSELTRVAIVDDAGLAVADTDRTWRGRFL